MLTKANCGKYLTKEYGEVLLRGVKDRDDLTAEELAWCAIPTDMGYGKEDEDTFKFESQPVDRFTASRKTLDYRVVNHTLCDDIGGE
jgi:hypothetical protein